MNRLVRIYTDGSYKNDLIAFGFIIQGLESNEVIKIGISRPGTKLQNVEAELRAVLEAFKYLKRTYGSLLNYTVVLCYDLELIKSIINNPKAQARNGYFKNYVEQFTILQRSLGCRIIFEKVRGHYHEIHNKVDRLVRRKINQAQTSTQGRKLEEFSRQRRWKSDCVYPRTGSCSREKRCKDARNRIQPNNKRNTAKENRKNKFTWKHNADNTNDKLQS